MASNAVKKAILLVFSFSLIFLVGMAFDEKSSQASTDPSHLIIIIDASGSMYGQMQGRSKMDIAKESLVKIVQELPPKTHIGLIVYGHRRKGDCQDVEEMVSPSPLGAQKMNLIVPKIQPKGKTPITLSLHKALNALENRQGSKTILLISDGKETCGGDPCRLVKDFNKRGVQFVTHVVGFDVTPEEKKQLSCIAKEGGGKYYSAQNAADFQVATKAVAQKATDQTPGSLKLVRPKGQFLPGEKIQVLFQASASYPSHAWVGVIPSSVAHGKESENDQHDLTYQYLKNRTEGTLTFDAPYLFGSFDFRMQDGDHSGREVASVSFEIIAPPSGPKPSLSIVPSNKEFNPNEEIQVRFQGQSYFHSNAWVGIIPSHVAHGKESVNDQHDLSYQYLNKKTAGVLKFQAPNKSGNYDFRMNNADKNGSEVASVSFVVKGQDQDFKPHLVIKNKKTIYAPGEAIQVQFSASSHYPANAWVGIIPSKVGHGSESVNDQHDITYQYLDKRTQGVLTFAAPNQSGAFDFRMHDTDSSGKEVSSISFVVK